MKRRNEMEKEKTITQTIIDYLTQKTALSDDKTFLIKEVAEAHRFNLNTISTIVSRDLIKKGLVIKTDSRRGMSVIYQFDPNGKPAPKVKKIVTKLRKADQTNDSYDSYVKIGKGIEELIQSKNDTIKGLENQLKSAKKMILDLEATVQDRDRHIVEQGKKIHGLNEKIRNKSGGSIKLDELQSIINNK